MRVVLSFCLMMLLPMSHAVSFRAFDHQVGLSSAEVTAVAEDRHGVIWLGTAEGIYRLNDLGATPIESFHDSGATRPLYVLDMQWLDNGQLLIAADIGLFLFNPLTQTLTDIAEQLQLPAAMQVSTLFRGPKQGLWFIDDSNTLYGLDPRAGSVLRRTQLPKEVRWQYLHWDADGALWGASAHRLHRLSGDEAIRMGSNLWESPINEIRGLRLGHDGQSYLIAKQGLYRLDIQRNRLSRLEVPQGDLLDLQFSAAGDMWLMLRDQLWVIEANNEQPRQVVSAANLRLQINDHQWMRFDSQGRLWMARHSSGITALKPDSASETLQLDRTSYPAMRDEMVWSLLEHGNTLFVGTESGMDWFEPSTQQHGIVALSDDHQAITSYSMALYGEQIYLASTAGMYVIDPLTRQGKAVEATELAPLNYHTLFDLQTDGDSLLIVTESISYRWWPAQQQLTPLMADDKPLKAALLRRDHRGWLWAAGDSVLGYFDQQQRWHSLLDDFDELHQGHLVGMLLPKADGSLWFGSFGRGLWRLDSINDTQPKSVNDQYQLACSNPYLGTEFDGQTLIGCDQQLFAFEDQQVRSVDRFDGLGMGELNEGAYTVSQRWGLLVGSNSGVTGVNPLGFPSQRPSPPVLQEMLVYYPEDQQQRFVMQSGLIDVGADYQLISFDLSSPRLLDSGSKRYRYRLNRGEQLGPLRQLSQRDVLNFSGLKAGHYQLEVYLQTRGLWSAQPTVIEFQVLRFWWQSPWALALLVIAVAALLLCWGAWRSRHLARLARVNRELSRNRRSLNLALAAGRSAPWAWSRATDLLVAEDHQKVLSLSGKQVELALTEMPIHPEDYEPTKAAWYGHLEGTLERYDVVFRVRTSRGDWRWLQVSGQVVTRDVNGQAEQVTGIYSDISEQQQMRHEHSLFAQALANTSEGVLILDKALNIHQSNPAAARTLRNPRLVGQPLVSILPAEHQSTLTEMAQQGSNWQGELQLLRLDGVAVPVWLNLSPMEHPGNYSVALFSDITVRKMAEQELRQLANYDSLTKLPNRAQFATKLKQHIQRRQIQSQPQSMALLFLDLDRFKHINDTYGHSTGDALLVEAAQRLTKVLSEGVELCRFGGDEFLVLVPEAADKQQLLALGHQILDAIAQPFWVGAQPFYVSTSIGVAMWPQDGAHSEALIKHADLAMYHAKDNGRGTVCFYAEQRDAKATYQLDLENALRLAIREQSLSMHFQPQLDLYRCQVTGVEALLRWYDDDGNAISPAQFIPLAESCGLVVPLDRWALRHACQSFASWPITQSLMLSVNVSAMHFHQPDYVEFVSKVLLETGMSPQQLCLEITEGVLIKQVELAQSHLQALRRLGVSVSVDDFGTGYSSLAYLGQFAVDELKIDRSFVHDLSEQGNGAIVRTVVDLGRNLGLQVIAEGVETEEQEHYLQLLGCQRVQGYRYAKPMPAAECVAYLQQSWRNDVSRSGASIELS